MLGVWGFRALGLGLGVRALSCFLVGTRGLCVGMLFGDGAMAVNKPSDTLQDQIKPLQTLHNSSTVY